MTDKDIYFDADCLICFLCVGKQSILIDLFTRKIIIPEFVYAEIRRFKQYPYKGIIDDMISTNCASKAQIIYRTEESKMFLEMTQNPKPGFIIVGKGEAEAMTLAFHRDGLLASNNFTDIRQYFEPLGLRNISSSEILEQALCKGIISEKDGNEIWACMLQFGRRLPSDTFSQYLATK
jgi:predicted nucleic acid-binding protein